MSLQGLIYVSLQGLGYVSLQGHVEAKTFEPSRAESHLFFPTSSLSSGLLGSRQIS